MTSKTILVTGASTGIGRACADLLFTRGHTIIGASRRPANGVPWSPIEMDVDDDASVEFGIGEALSEHGGFDAVVTCAGWGLAGAVEQTPLSDAKAQFETNFFGTVRVIRASLPALRERKGRIVLMSSIGGVIGLPFQSYYSASKFALEGWAEALAWEVKPFGVHVTLVEPGSFRTEFTGSRRTVETSGDDPYERACTKAVSVMEHDELKGSDPSAVAKRVEKVLASRRPPRRLSVGPMDERIGPFAKRLLPYRAFEAASASSLGV